MEEKEIDAHNVTVEELCKRLNTSIEAGLTNKKVAEAMEDMMMMTVIIVFVIIVNTIFSS